MGEVVENQGVPRQQQAEDNAWRLDINKFKPTRPAASQNPKAHGGCLNQRFGKAKEINDYYEHQQALYNGYSEVDKLDVVDARWVPDTRQMFA